MMDLSRIQKRQTEMLRVFDAFCREQQLTYCLAYGTLLGAARHAGPIPWDDDVDILMPRCDWFRLARLDPDCFPEPLFLQTPACDSDYRKPYVPMRIRDRYSRYEEEIETGEVLGSFIDVFPLDIWEENQRPLWEKWNPKISRISSLYLPKSWRDASLSPLKSKLRYLIQTGVQLLPPRYFLRWVHHKACLLNGLPPELSLNADHSVRHNLPSKPVMQTQSPISGPEADVGPCAESSWMFVPEQLTETTFASTALELIEQDCFLASDFFPLRSLPYENLSLPVPNRMDKILTTWYGNYLQYPPPEERHMHCRSYSESPWPDEWSTL